MNHLAVHLKHCKSTILKKYIYIYIYVYIKRKKATHIETHCN